MEETMSKNAGRALALAVALHFALPVCAAHAEESVKEGAEVQTDSVNVEADAAKEEAKYDSQSTTIITKEDIARK